MITETLEVIKHTTVHQNYEFFRLIPFNLPQPTESCLLIISTQKPYTDVPFSKQAYECCSFYIP